MPISGKRMMALLDKLAFERLAPFDSEKKGASILAEEITALGLTPTYESFPVPAREIKTARFEITEPFYKEIECTGYGFAGNGAKDGIEAEFVYIEGREGQDRPHHLRSFHFGL